MGVRNYRYLPGYIWGLLGPLPLPLLTLLIYVPVIMPCIHSEWIKNPENVTLDLQVHYYFAELLAKNPNSFGVVYMDRTQHSNSNFKRLQMASAGTEPNDQ